MLSGFRTDNAGLNDNLNARRLGPIQTFPGSQLPIVAPAIWFLYRYALLLGAAHIDQQASLFLLLFREPNELFEQDTGGLSL